MILGLTASLSHEIKVTRDMARKNWSLHKNSLLLHTYPPTPQPSRRVQRCYIGGDWARVVRENTKVGGGQLSEGSRKREGLKRRISSFFSALFNSSSRLYSFPGEHFSQESVVTGDAINGHLNWNISHQYLVK